MALYHWAKGERADMKSFSHAIDLRNASAKATKTLASKNKNTQKDIETLNAGGKSMTTLLKKKEDVGKLENKISTREVEIEYQGKLAELLTVYLGGECLREFKKNKLDVYRKMITHLHATEIGNSHKKATFFNSLLNEENVKASTSKHVEHGF